MSRPQNNREAAASVERFFLYGLPERPFDAHFVHVESIEDRRELHNFDIRPHVHASLHQIVLFRAGGGDVLIEEKRHDFEAPALFVAPPRTVHGYRLSTDTEAPVITLAENFHREIAAGIEPGLARALDLPQLHRLTGAELTRHRLADVVAAIAAEYSWPGGPGHVTLVAAQIAMLFVAIARLAAERNLPQERAGRHSSVFVRFRALVEDSFREDRPIGDYARALSVTEGLLNVACRQTIGRSPLAVVHERRITEAKRLLLFSPMTANEIAYTLGFRDPAYFSRFFTRATGLPPGRFRSKASSRSSVI